MTKVTVGIVTYNSETYIDQCLQSLLNNAQQITEIILVDNGSQDSTVAKVKSINHKKIKLIINFQNNIALARSIIVNQCKTKYTCFVDSDCVVPNNWIEQLVSGIESHQGIKAYGGPNRLPEKNFQSLCINNSLKYFLGHGGSPQAKLSSQISKVSHVPTTNSIFDVIAVKKAGNFNSKYSKVGEDLELGAKMNAKGYDCMIGPEPLILNDSVKGYKEWFFRMFKFGSIQPKIFCKFLFTGYIHWPFLLFIFSCLVLGLAIYFNFFIELLIGYIAVLFSLFIREIRATKNFISALGTTYVCVVTNVGYFLGQLRGLFPI